MPIAHNRHDSKNWKQVSNVYLKTNQSIYESELDKITYASQSSWIYRNIILDTIWEKI